MSDGRETFERAAFQALEEEAAARAILRGIDEHRWRSVTLPLPDAWITLGMACELVSVAHDLLVRAPDDSAHVARLATEILARLDPGEYPRISVAQVTAGAWKELANAYRYRSDYDAAFHALGRADAALAGELALASDQAVLQLARAVLLRDTGRTAEAAELLAAARVVFVDHVEEGRVAECDVLAGMIHQGAGRAAEALAAYRQAAIAAERAGDPYTVAVAHANSSLVDAGLGRSEAAIAALRQARAILIKLEAPTEAARIDVGVALALLQAGKYDAAIPVFREARRAFRGFSMREEAGIAGVALAEAYLALGRHAAAERLIEVVIDEFRASRLNERAVEALRYLQAVRSENRHGVVRHVYEYLVRLSKDPVCLSVHDASAAGARAGSTTPHRGSSSLVQKATNALRQMLRWRLTGDGDFLFPPRPKESPTYVSPCGDGTPCPKTTP